MAESVVDDGLDEEDLEHFIGELQRIIVEFDATADTKGMQGRFARTISYLQGKKRGLSTPQPSYHRKVETESKEQIYDDLFAVIETLQGRDYGRKKFKTLLKLAKLREEIAREKKRYGHRKL